MTKTSAAPFAVCLLAAAALAACSSPNADWQKASSEGTVAAYRSFIRHHPNDPRDQQARNRIATLQDTQAWETAKSAGTQQAYRHYLATSPDGAYTADAQARLTSLQQASAWQSAKATGTAAAYEAFVREFPNAPQASRAHTEIDKLAGYQLQLGRFRSASAAAAAAKRLRARFASLLTGIQVVPPSGADKLTTLRSQQLSHAAARAACAQLRRVRQSCSVVKARSQAGGISLSGV